MATVTPQEANRRRAPSQERSRARVEQILDAASAVLVDQGVDALTTRAIANQAGIPVASLYQYFADRDAVMLAIVERDTAEMDEQTRLDLATLEVISVRSLVETTMRAYVTVYHRRPAFMRIWLRGRTNSAVYDYGRQHNRRTAQELFQFAKAAGLVPEDVPTRVAELAVEIGDRVFQLAFEEHPDGDPELIDEGIDVVATYLERYATPEGVAGVSR